MKELRMIDYFGKAYKIKDYINKIKENSFFARVF